MLTIIAALAVLSILCVAVYYLSRDVLLGWYCFLGAAFIGSALGFNRFIVGGLHIDPGDIMVLCLLAAGTLRFLARAQESSNARIIAMAYLALFVFSYTRGLATEGLATASNDGRGLTGEAVGMLYFFTIPIDRTTIVKFVKALLYYGAGLLLLAIYKYITGDVAETGRPLLASDAEHINICFLFCIGWLVRHPAPRLVKWSAIPFGAAIVLLQHRTVWAATIAAIAFAFLIDMKLVYRFIPGLAIAGGVAFVSAGYVYGNQSAAKSQLQESAQNTGTLDWRIDAWRQSIEDEDQTLVTILAGKPFGSGYVRFEINTQDYENLPPHSEYVNQYLRVGLLGTLLLIAYMARPLYLLSNRQSRAPTSLFPSCSIWALGCLSAMVYGGAYSYDAITFSIIGVSNALLLAPEIDEDAQPELQFENEEEIVPNAIA